MREIVLDGAAMATRQQAHDQLAEALALPEYYGRNLDALYDCLTDIGDETVIYLKSAGVLANGLGAYGRLLVDVLENSARQNPNITFAAE